MKLKPLIFVLILCCAMAPFARTDAASGMMTITVTVVFPPAAPSGLAATAVSYSEIDLHWTDNSNNETGFVIEESVGNDSLFSPIDTVGANMTSYARTGLLPNTTYYYRVAAYNNAGFGSFSNESSATTGSLPAGACTPSSTQSCVSSANSCGMTNVGTETCGSGYTWGACSASAPSNSLCGNNSGSGGSGGGGGGGGGFPVLPPPGPSQANVTIAGSAYPLSTVTILKDAQVALTTIAGPDGNFSGTLTNLPAGSYEFSVYASDGNGNRSSLFTFPATLTDGASTQVSGVFLSPTISVDKQEVKQGDTLVIFGQAVPDAQVNINVHSGNTILATTTSGKNGAYVYDFDTSALAMGSHDAVARAVSGNMVSDDSESKSFLVGNENIPSVTSTACATIGDFNGDCRVNLIDFSILAYWYGKANPPAEYDLNGDGKIDLIDFSILAYYWTG